MTDDAAVRHIAGVAARQHGNVTTAQLRAAGFSDQQISRRVRAGVLVRRHTGVYAVGHRPLTRESRWCAAVLALGPDAVLSHRAAAALWGIHAGSTTIDVLVPTTAGRGRRDGLVVHRAPLRPEDVTVRHGIRVTTLLRTLLDLAAVVSPYRLERAFEEAQVRHGLSPEDLAVEVLSRRRYRGNARLGRLLAAAVDPEAVRSILELRFLKLCQAHGISRPLVNELVGTWRPDFRWEDERVIVETDGLRFHQTAAKRRRDAQKDAAMRALGYTVVRLTWADVTEDPAATAALVRDVLDQGRDERRLVVA